MKKKTPLLIGVAALTLGAILLVVIVAMQSKPKDEARKISSVTVQKDGNTLEIDGSGRVSFTKDGKTFVDFWDGDKLATFYKYLDGKYVGEGELVTGGQNYVVISGSGGDSTYVLDDDELIDAVEDDTETGGGGGGTGGSGGGTGGSGGSTATPGPTTVPTPTSSGGGGFGGIDPECLYWRLSYCVRKRTPSPVPSVTPQAVEIREPSCDANTQTGRTVIGNDLCIPTPSPTP